MEGRETWCDIQQQCDFPISNGLLNDPAAASDLSDDSGMPLPLTLRSLETDMFAGNESNLTNSTCVYPFCVAVLSFTINNTK